MPFLGILSLGVFWRLFFIAQDVSRLVNFPLVDDTFYSLGIARNWALGKGLTHDGFIQTNGFQPLFVFLSAPIYYFFPNDKITPLYIVLSLQTLLGACTGYIVYHLMRKNLGEKAALFSAFLWFVPVTMFKFDINGLETGLCVFFLMLSVAFYIENIRAFNNVTPKKSLVFGAILGMTVLSRNDACFLNIAFIIDFMWLNMRRFNKDRRILKEFLKEAGICTAAFLIVIFPWFYFNAVQFGSIIPQSGRAVRILSQKFLFSDNIGYLDNPFLYGVKNIIYSVKRLVNQNPLFEPFLWLGTYLNLFQVSSYLVSGVIGAVSLFLLFDIKKFRVFWKQTGLSVFRFAWIYFFIMIMTYSFFVFGQHHFPRYYFPVQAIFLFLPAAVFKYLHWRFPLYIRKVGYLFLFFFFLTVNLGNFETRKYWRHNVDLGACFQISSCREKYFEKNDILGAFQSGTIGYFFEQRVVNLDGVVNIIASKHIAQGTMVEYIKSQKINYLIDAYSQYRALLGMSPEEMALDSNNFELVDDCYIKNDRIRIFRVVYPD